MKPDTIILVGSPEGISARVELALSLHHHPIDIVRCETKKDVIAVCPTGISPLDFPGISMALPTKRDKKEYHTYSRVPPKKLRK